MAASVCKTTKLIFIGLLLVYQAVSQELSSTLHSTPYGVQVAYADEMVVFTCVVRGSNSMAWTSDEYIGPGLRLPLASVQGVGHEVHAVGNDQTVAVLVNTTTDIDVIIVSELHIRINSGYPVASVQCVNSGANTESSISFLLAGATLVTCDRQIVCPDDTVTCTCATGNSNSLAWMNNGNRLEFMSNDPLLTRHSISGSSAFAVLTESSDTNGVRVITSNFIVSTSINSNDPEIILTCENVDRAMIEPIIIPMAENCAVNPKITDQVTIPTGPGNENAPLRDSCVGAITAAIVIPIIIVALFVPFMIIVGILIHKCFKTQLEKCEGEIETSKINYEEQIEALKKDAEIKDGLVKEKDAELKDLISSVKKDNDTAMRKLQEQMVKEKEQALERLRKTMNEDQTRVLKALEVQMDKDIKQALEKGANMEKEEAIKYMKTALGNLKTKMENGISEALAELEGKTFHKDKDIKKGSENKKQGTWEAVGNIVAKYNPFSSST